MSSFILQSVFPEIKMLKLIAVSRLPQYKLYEYIIFFKEYLFLVPNSRILIILIGLINTIQIQGNLSLQGS